MSVPPKRRPKSAQGGRAAHLRLKKKVFTACSHCKKEIPTHQACPFCGYYKGREVIHIKLKKEKGKKKKEKSDKPARGGPGGEEKESKKQDKAK